MESLVAWIKVTKKRALRVVDLDVDRSPELTRRLGVSRTPSLVLLDRGQVVGSLVGRSTGREIEAFIRTYLPAEEQAMAMTEDQLDAEDVGYGAAHEGDLERAPDQVQPEERTPPSDEETDQDDYANTDESVE